jgi:hypothetical protein
VRLLCRNKFAVPVAIDLEGTGKVLKPLSGEKNAAIALPSADSGGRAGFPIFSQDAFS